MSPLAQPFRALLDWPTSSLQRARRNAMVAANELARRRAEADEVDAFLATWRAEPVAEPGLARA